MKETSELIDAWLDDALPEAERRQVEQRMATDEAFRREVELQRALRKTLGDPGRWRLFSALEAAMQEPLPGDEPPPASPPPPGKSRWKWWVAVPVVLIIGAGIWYFWKPEVKPEPPATETPATKPTENQPKTPEIEQPTETVPSPPSIPPQKPGTTTPIAQADPANFTENPAMEALMGVRGGSDLSVEMTTPQNSAVFRPDGKGKTNLRFSGRLAGAAPNEAVSLDLLLFNNRNSKQPLLTLPLQPTADAAGKAGFDLRQAVELPQGLYYLRLEDRSTGELLVVGRFFIGKL